MSNGCGSPVPFDEQQTNKRIVTNRWTFCEILAKVSSRLRVDAPSFNSVTRALTRRLCEVLPFEQYLYPWCMSFQALVVDGFAIWLRSIKLYFGAGLPNGKLDWNCWATELQGECLGRCKHCTDEFQHVVPNRTCKTHISQIITSYHKWYPYFLGSVHWVRSQAKPAPIAFSWMLLGQVGHCASFSSCKFTSLYKLAWLSVLFGVTYWQVHCIPFHPGFQSLPVCEAVSSLMIVYACGRGNCWQGASGALRRLLTVADFSFHPCVREWIIFDHQLAIFDPAKSIHVGPYPFFPTKLLVQFISLLEADRISEQLRCFSR